MNQKHPLRPWFIWGLAAFFFFAHYVVRVTPGQITEEIQLAFIATTKLDIGVLGAAFYLPYVLMQTPVGLLVDKYGPRILLTFAVFLCGLSAFLFAKATFFQTAVLSRILLGLCSATAFIGALKLITNWFDASKLALLVGITQALGMIGASFGTGIMPGVIDNLGWRNTFMVYGVLFFILSVFIFAIIKNHPNNRSQKSASSNPVKIPIRSVIFNRYTWINAFYAGLLYAPSDAMGELWGKEFIKNIHGLDAQFASTSISFLFIGWAIGGPLAGALADRVGRKPIMLASALCGMILLPIIFYMPNLNAFWLILVMFLYGLTNTGLIACYATAGELHDRSHAGLSLGITNMLSVLVGALLMPVIGLLLEWQHRLTQSDLIHYSAVEYQKATIILPLCLVVAMLLALVNKETLVKNGSQSK